MTGQRLPLDLPDATAFVSYVHADDQSEGGTIARFVTDLADRYHFLFGRRVELFFDRRDLQWGELWERRLTQEIERTTFLMAVVTPRFLNSDYCRKEVIEFSTVSRRVGEPKLMLPLIWRMPPGLLDAPPDDPVVAALRSAQWEEIGDLRYADPTSGDYRRKLDHLAERLHETALALEAKVAPSDLTEMSANDKGPELEADLFDAFEKFEEFGGRWPTEIDELLAEVNSVADTLTGLGAPPQAPSTRVVRAWATRAAEALSEPIGRLDSAVEAVRGTWAELDRTVSHVLAQINSVPALMGQPAVAEFLNGVRGLPA
ncbi:MAG: toll/interleukin-1 receptor domain-containing protein, partial [bacterium]